MKKIILIGYMTSGKSTIGKIVSEKTDLRFFDLDSVIEEKTKKSIKELFETEGEVKFRKLEHQVLNEFLLANDQFVLSMGGGTPCYANNHVLLQQDDIDSFYLKASVKELTDRLKKDKDKRPLVALKEDAELEDFIAKHLFDRSYFYHQAKFVVSVDGKMPDEVADEILKRLA